MSKPLNTMEKRHLRRQTEEIVKNAKAAEKANGKPVGRVAPQTRTGQNAVPTPFTAAAKNGLKPTATPGTRPTSASSNAKPWQRPKPTPSSVKPTQPSAKPTPPSAAAQVNKSESTTRPTSAAARRVSAGQSKATSASNNPSTRPPSAANARTRTKTASSIVGNNSPSHAPSNNPRTRASSTPKDVSTKPPVNNRSKVDGNAPVSYKSGDAVVLPKIEKSDATLVANNKEMSDTLPEGDEKLLAPPRRSRAHVMPVSKTAKPQKKGHDFIPHELTDWVNWCDACGSIILSLFGKCVKCKKCMMVCHGKCALSVSLTCEADEIRAALGIDPSWYKTIVEETKDESTLKEYNTIHRVMPRIEIKERIENFNKTVKSTQQMTLQEDGETFRGFIRVTMNLTRPVSVAADEKDKRKLQRNNSFYVNKGALKALYLSSNTTAEEVVTALLNKYGIKDNPLKFALYEKLFREEGHIILRKMMTRERPLFLRLLWEDGDTKQHAFILQENESREIQWESFSLPELNTFLKILQKEQEDHVTCIKTKFNSKRQDLLNAMEYQKKKGSK